MGTPLRSLATRPGPARPTRSRPWLLLLGLGLVGAWAPPAFASRQVEPEQIVEDEGTLEQAEQDSRLARSLGELVDVRLYSGSEFVIGSDFDEFRATSYEPAGRAKVTLPVAKNAAVRLVVRGSALLYDFGDVSTTLFGTPTSSDPFGNLYATGVQLQGGLRPDWSGLFSEEERWSLVGEIAARSRWEDGASFGSAVTTGGSLGVGYQIGDWLEIILGAGVSTSLFDGGVSASPIVEFDWRFAERWSVRTRGRGGQIEYDIADDLTVFAGGQMESRSYLMADRAGIGEGRLRDKSVPVELGLRWDMNELVEMTLTGGAVLKHELRVNNEDGNEVGHVRAGPTPFVGVTFALRPQRRRGAAAAQAPQRSPASGSSSTSISTSR